MPCCIFTAPSKLTQVRKGQFGALGGISIGFIFDHRNQDLEHRIVVQNTHTPCNASRISSSHHMLISCRLISIFRPKPEKMHPMYQLAPIDAVVLNNDTIESKDKKATEMHAVSTHCLVQTQIPRIHAQLIKYPVAPHRISKLSCPRLAFLPQTSDAYPSSPS